MDSFQMIAKEYYNHSSGLTLRICAEGWGQTYIRNSDKVASEQNLDFKLQYLSNQVTMKIIVKTLSSHF